MSYLDEQWFERGFAALLESLNFDADTRKNAIQFLFDEGFWDSEKLSWGAAEGRFRDCCNRNKGDATWKLPEVWALMKRFGRHHFAIAMIEDLGYDVTRRATEQRKQDLLERAVRALEQAESACAGLSGEIARFIDEDVRASVPRPSRPRPNFSRGQW